MRPKLIVTLQRFLFSICVAGLVSSGTCQAEVPLPTAKEHYQNFDASQAGMKVFSELVGELDAPTQKVVLEMANAPDAAILQKIPRSEVLSVLRSINWKKWKAPILEEIGRASCRERV